MVRKAIVEQSARGGNGFGAADTSDDLIDMTPYEKAICNEAVFDALASLEIKTADTDMTKYEYVILDKSDVPEIKADSFGAFGHAANAEFAALGIPCRAVPYATKDVVKTPTKSGTSSKKTNELKIYRTGAEFDPSLYASRDGNRVNKEGKALLHEDYTDGQKLRADKFVNEVAMEEYKPATLVALGIATE